MENTEKSEISAIVKEAVEEVKKEFSEVTERKLPENKVVDSNGADLKTAIKSLVTGTREIHTKSLQDGGATTGGPFVPEEFSKNIAVVLGQYSAISKFTRLPMLSDTMNVPTITTKPTVYVVSEGSQITASDLVSANVQLATKKIASLNPFSNEWLSDAYPLEQVLTPVVANNIAKKIEEVALSGSPTFTKGALITANQGVTANATSTSSSFYNLVATDFTKLIGKLESVEPNLSNGAEFFMHPAVYDAVRSLTATTGNFILVDGINGNPPTILGYPVYKTTVLPGTAAASTRIAMFGNPKWIYWGDRAGMTMTLGTEGTVGSDNLFEKDMSALRTVTRLDVQLILPNTFAYLETGK